MSCSTFDGEVLECPADFRPKFNNDIIGVGVRVSFYIQSLLVACLSLRSTSEEEFRSAFYTLFGTNVAMVVTSFVLGLSSTPRMSFHDGIVVIYLLATSGFSMVLALPSTRAFLWKSGLFFLHFLQGILISSFILVMIFMADTFGSRPCCNSTARIAIFKTYLASDFRAQQSKFIPLVAVSVVVCLGIPSLIISWLFRHFIRMCDGEERLTEAEAEGSTPHAVKRWDNHSRRPWVLLSQLAFFLIYWIIMVANTELVISENEFEGSTEWQFGQLMPLVLVAVPLMNTIKAYGKWAIFSHSESESKSEEVKYIPLNQGSAPGTPSSTSSLPTTRSKQPQALPSMSYAK